MMISLTSRYYAASNQDVELLRRILTALGLPADETEPISGKRSSSAAPIGFRPSQFRFLLIPSKNEPHTDLSIQVSDPLLALRLAQENGGKIDAPSSDQEISEAGFRLILPSGARVHFGVSSDQPGSDEIAGISGGLNGVGKRFAIVVARFNAFITERLLRGAFEGLLQMGVEGTSITVVRVPGAFEIPTAARALAVTKNHDAIICIGCLLRGDTAHYDVIVNEVTRGIGQSALDTAVPHAFGVLTCDTLEQAIDRAGLKMGNKGLEAAMAAVEMATLGQRIATKSAVSKPAKSRKPKKPLKKPVARRSGKSTR